MIRVVIGRDIVGILWFQLRVHSASNLPNRFPQQQIVGNERYWCLDLSPTIRKHLLYCGVAKTWEGGGGL